MTAPTAIVDARAHPVDPCDRCGWLNGEHRTSCENAPIPSDARCGFCTMPLTPVSRAHQSIVAPGLYACSETCASILNNRTVWFFSYKVRQ